MSDARKERAGRMGFDSESARTAAKRSHHARRRLLLCDVEDELPPLTDLDSAKHRLDRIGIWAAAGLVPGTVAGAVVRSVEVWIKAHESELTNRVVDELKGDLARLRRELKGRPPLSVTR